MLAIPDLQLVIHPFSYWPWCGISLFYLLELTGTQYGCGMAFCKHLYANGKRIRDLPIQKHKLVSLAANKIHSSVKFESNSLSRLWGEG